MILFWSLVTAMVVLALAFVLPPILRGGKKSGVTQNDLNIAVLKEQMEELQWDLDDGALSKAQFAAAKKDLERELLYDLSGTTPGANPTTKPGGRWAAVALLAAVPALAFGLYQEIGASKLIPILQAAAEQPKRAAAPAPAPATAPDQRMPSIDEMVTSLAARLEQQPNDPQGWTMLGRSYMALRRYGEAATAYARADQLAPGDATLIASQAEAIALNDGGRLSGRPAELLAKALELQPTNPKALWLNGNLHFQEADYPQAVAAWNALLPQLQPGGEQVETVAGLIQEAQSRMGVAVAETAKPLPVATPSTPVTPAEPAAKALTVTVSLDASLKNQAAPEDTLFVFARAAQGPRMPLAIVRKQVKDLPLTVTLDDSMAMTPAATLSKFPQVVVGARVSKSGNAMPQSGDLNGTSQAVAPGHPETIAVTIDGVTP